MPSTFSLIHWCVPVIDLSKFGENSMYCSHKMSCILNVPLLIRRPRWTKLKFNAFLFRIWYVLSFNFSTVLVKICPCTVCLLFPFLYTSLPVSLSAVLACSALWINLPHSLLTSSLTSSIAAYYLSLFSRLCVILFTSSVRLRVSWLSRALTQSNHQSWNTLRLFTSIVIHFLPHGR